MKKKDSEAMMRPEPKPILLPKDDWKKIAVLKGCYNDKYPNLREFDIAKREKDLSLPPYPFDTTRCVQRCKDKGFRYAAVRQDSTEGSQSSKKSN